MGLEQRHANYIGQHVRFGGGMGMLRRHTSLAMCVPGGMLCPSSTGPPVMCDWSAGRRPGAGFM